MEGFMRKIYNFINGLEILHLIGNEWIIWFKIINSNEWGCVGTYEKVEEEEEEVYEVINVHKLKAATPNLRVINMYGITFVDDSHIEAFSSNCIQVGENILTQAFNYYIKYFENNNLCHFTVFFHQKNVHSC